MVSTIERLRARLAEATPGPWRWVHDSGSTMLWNAEPVGGPGHVLTPYVCASCAEHGTPCLGPIPADAALIAAAVNALPALLDVAEAAAKSVEWGDVGGLLLDDVAALRAALDRLDGAS